MDQTLDLNQNNHHLMSENPEELRSSAISFPEAEDFVTLSEEETPPTSSSYEDLTLECRDCGNPFIFTAGEREWFAAHNFVSPARCPRCRKASKEQIAEGERQPQGRFNSMNNGPQITYQPQGYQNQGYLQPTYPAQGGSYPSNNVNSSAQNFGYTQNQPAFGNQLGYHSSYNGAESSGFTYRTYCRRCGGEARVPYTGRSNQPILCRVCRDPNSAQTLAN